MSREIKYSEAINEAFDQCMAEDQAVYLMGLGVPDEKGVFGTTLGLEQKYGSGRVMDMPTAENGMTGVAIGSALVGMRPIITHQRVDFALLSVDQIVNQAAKWHYMFGGRMHVPLVIRMLVGRGWGQGPQHSQSLHAWFMHTPGLKVVAPATPYDAKGLLAASIADNNPVVFFEHRWLHNMIGPVPEELYSVPIGQARVARSGNDLTIVALSHMTVEALRAAEILKTQGIGVEVIDVRTLRPLDETMILKSVKKTGRLVVADISWKSCGFSAEIIAIVAERALSDLKSAPRRIAYPDCPAPTTRALANHYYPLVDDIVGTVKDVLGLSHEKALLDSPSTLLDVPDLSFTGPF